jgi:hypothetical protein
MVRLGRLVGRERNGASGFVGFAVWVFVFEVLVALLLGFPHPGCCEWHAWGCGGGLYVSERLRVVPAAQAGEPARIRKCKEHVEGEQGTCARAVHERASLLVPVRALVGDPDFRLCSVFCRQGTRVSHQSVSQLSQSRPRASFFDDFCVGGGVCTVPRSLAV